MEAGSQKTNDEPMRWWGPVVGWSPNKEKNDPIFYSFEEI